LLVAGGVRVGGGVAVGGVGCVCPGHTKALPPLPAPGWPCSSRGHAAHGRMLVCVWCGALELGASNCGQPYGMSFAGGAGSGCGGAVPNCPSPWCCRHLCVQAGAEADGASAARLPFDAAVVSNLYHKEMKTAKGIDFSRCMMLEFSGFLENYLWPNFDATSSHEHVMCIVLVGAASLAVASHVRTCVRCVLLALCECLCGVCL
jgi:hypothetical protein